MGKPFKGWQCGSPPPHAGGWMNQELRRGCIRTVGHPGPHRTRVFEWDQGERNLDNLRVRASRAAAPPEEP